MNDYRLRRLEGVSGRVWIVDEREQAASSGGQTTPFYGWPEDDEGERHWVQRAIGGTDSWMEEREHLRRAYRTGRLPEVVASTFIHGPVDLIDNFDVYLVSELAETDLHRVLLSSGSLDPSNLAVLEERLRAALDVLHALRLVYSDLREDNVLRVGGEWKLGDLGGVVGFGEPIISIQVDEAYRLDGAELGVPAAPENDVYALAVLLEHAARGPS